jgi:hypothetical protein
MEKTRHIIIIGHPKRETLQLKIDNKEYKISFDGFKCESKNEDPFIWNDNFFYTFCHSNVSLCKDVRTLIEKQNEEVYFVFVAKAKVDKKDITEIDTIIKAKELFEWPKKGERKEGLLRKKFNKNIIKYHLPELVNGNLTDHNRNKLFTCIGDEEESFLPMKKYNDSFEPYRLDNDIWELINAEGSNRNYVVKEESPRFKEDIAVFEKVSNEISNVIDMYNEPVKDESLSKLTGKQIKKFYEVFRAEEKKLQNCKS